MPTREITNSDDIIDSREIDERIKELELLADDWEETHELEEWQEWEDSDEGIELHNLSSLRDDLSSDEWQYGVTLIRDSYFQEYAEELVKDIGDLPKDLPLYIESNIDWKGVADDIRQDYTSAEFDGVTYWARSY